MLNTTKAENCAFDAITNVSCYTPTGLPVNVSKREAHRKEIITMVSLDFQGLVEKGLIIRDEDRLTPLDRAVYSAIVTLWVEGHKDGNRYNEYVTPRVIFQLLSGNSGQSKDIGAEVRKEILRSIDKMRCTDITIDFSKECEESHGKYNKVNYKGSILPSERVECVKLNGNEAYDCIHLLCAPPLYGYAEAKNQIVTVSVQMLNTPLRNTPENIELKEYLLRRILSMKKPKSRQSNIIKYDTIYKILRLCGSSKQDLYRKKKKIHDNIIRLLDFWKQENFICSYEYTDGTRKSAPKMTIQVKKSSVQ